MAAAMRKAASCPSLQEPLAAPTATERISSSVRRIPARLRSRMRYGKAMIQAVWGRGLRSAGEAWNALEPAERRAGGGAGRIEGRHLLLRFRAVGRLRELVEDPLIGLGRLLGALELLQRGAELVQENVLRHRRLALLQHGAQLLDHLLALALLTVEMDEVQPRLGAQHVLRVGVD